MVRACSPSMIMIAPEERDYSISVKIKVTFEEIFVVECGRDGLLVLSENSEPMVNQLKYSKDIGTFIDSNSDLVLHDLIRISSPCLIIDD